jgi:asparagine synthase (glutamine-hydrolysing)
MQERGPDRTSSASFATASLGVTRLAIADVPRGHQPFLAPSGGGAVGLNGAIYNARALTRRWGLQLATGNDGEVIWPLYRRFGLRFADELEGMYAVCIVDDERSRVVLAVDPIGIKPLYLSTEGGAWFAASTLQALPERLRRHAFRVPAGTVMTSDGEVARIEPRATVYESLRRALEASVEEQIPVEVPWGCMLSGGLDSSVLIALAARCRSGAVTISAGLPGSGDLAAALLVAATLGTDHHEELIDEEELPELIDAAVRATASPDGSTVMGGVGTYVAARAARRLGLKVLLSGEGADELFAGYDEYRLTPRALLDAELRADQEDLAATECLRLDRCTMAHGIEARVPYLSTAVVAHARALPLEDKLDPARPEPREKLALRRVADELLPPEVAWRPKIGFSTGAGLMAAGARLARRLVSDAELAAIMAMPGWTAFSRTQRLIGVDERLAALTFSRWRALHGEFGPWEELLGRGLARRFMSDGPYRPLTSRAAASDGSAPHRGVLVLASRMHAQHQYAEWLADLTCPALAIAHVASPPASDFAHVSLLNSWDEDEIVEQALALYRTHGFDRVIGLGEVDILPAGRIREMLNLPGQRAASALAYRDKLTMRRQAAAGTVEVPAFAPTGCAEDVVRFMRRHGGPVIVKPRFGGGTVGVRRVDDIAEAADLTFPDGSEGHIVEAFVEGPTFHVDALRLAGEIVLAVPCAYTGDGCLSHWADAGNGSWTLPPENPLFPRLVEATGGVLDALPGPDDLAIHAEFFLAGNNLVLCEAASRCGGIPIPSMLIRRLGTDMRELWSRMQCGLPVDWEAVERHLSRAPLVANFGLPPRDGRIRALPDEVPAGVEDLTIHCTPGEDFGGARYAVRRSGDFVATWVVTASEETELLRAIEATSALMEQAVLWDSPPASGDYREAGVAVAIPSVGESTN